MRLDGQWRVASATDELRRDGIGLDTDDSTWAELTVPGHWRAAPEFASSDGPLLYRRRYQLAEPPPGRRRWITFDGIFYQADIWLDGAYLGDPDGYFVKHSFDITALSRIGDEHVVAAEITCADQPDHRNKRNITGIFQNWPSATATHNPGGIWRSVHIYDTGPVKLDRYRVLCRDADASRAHLQLSTRLDSDNSHAITIRTLVDDRLVDESDRQLARGANDVSWSIDIAEPELWWPRSLGDQPLTNITAEIIVDGQLSDRRTRRTGLRQVAWNNWTCSVNGERIFLKGANLLPPRLDLANASALDCRRDIERAAELGLDAIRMYGHIGRRETYEAADELGIVIMQDFPLRGGYQRSVRDAATAQATAAVDEYGHHPSIIQWSAHDVPPTGTSDGDEPGSGSVIRSLAGRVPTWSTAILDRWVRHALERADPTRLVTAHSGVLPQVPLLDRADSQFYLGWYHGEITDLDRVARTAPRGVRFLSEFGAQSVPDSTGFIDDLGGTWPRLDWDALTEHYGYERAVFERRIPPEEFTDLETWRCATQTYQADLLRHQIELLRHRKYHPTGGFTLFCLNDPAPMISFSLFDHRRVAKAAVAAVANACHPVIVTLARPPAMCEVGTTIDIPVVVVNDSHRPIDDAIVDIEARWVGGRQRWRFGGPIEADSTATIAHITMTVPDVLGRLSFDLHLQADDIDYRNGYSSAITRTPSSPGSPPTLA